MKRPANQLCPLCGDEGEVESFGGEREFVASCPSCCARRRLAPTGRGETPLLAVDRWIRRAERVARNMLPGAA